MAGALSRRKVAAAVADQLLAGDNQAIARLAAYLIETKQTRAIDLVVRDIEAALLDRGTLVAEVASAHELTAQVKKELESFLASATRADNSILRYTVDESLIGGVRVKAPGAVFDTSIKTKLQQLKAAKQ